MNLSTRSSPLIQQQGIQLSSHFLRVAHPAQRRSTDPDWSTSIVSLLGLVHFSFLRGGGEGNSSVKTKNPLRYGPTWLVPCTRPLILSIWWPSCTMR